MAVVHRDLAGLRAEVEFEKAIAVNGGMAVPPARSSAAKAG